MKPQTARQRIAQIRRMNKRVTIDLSLVMKLTTFAYTASRGDTPTIRAQRITPEEIRLGVMLGLVEVNYEPPIYGHLKQVIRGARFSVVGTEKLTALLDQAPKGYEMEGTK